MSTRKQFVELELGPSDPITRRTTVQGMFVIGDYIDPETGIRKLALKRPSEETPKPAPKRRRAKKVNSQPAQLSQSERTVTQEALSGLRQ